MILNLEIILGSYILFFVMFDLHDMTNLLNGEHEVRFVHVEQHGSSILHRHGPMVLHPDPVGFRITRRSIDGSSKVS